MGLAVLNVLASAQRRGAETFAYELHQLLGHRGVRSTAVCLVPGESSPRLPLPTLGTRRYSPAVLSTLRRKAAGASVVVGHGSSTLLACGVATLGLQVPFVYVNIGDPRHWAATPGRRLRVGALLRRASAVAAISELARDVLISYFGVPPNRVWVIPNGRSADVFRPSSAGERTAARARLSLPDDAVVLASIGALSREKRLEVVLQAAAELPTATLIVAGDGPERSALAILADAVVPGRVRFLGAVSNVADLLAAVDLLVLSSDSEGVPGILVEAGLAAVPAVATDVGFVRDVVVPGVTGELVPPRRPDKLAQAVRRVLADRRTYGANAHLHCLARFEINKVGDQWAELLEVVTQRPKC